MKKMMFFGVYDRKVDGKKRLNVPTDFIHEFEDNKTLIVSRVSVLNKNILAVFPSIEVFDQNISSYMDIEIASNDGFFQRYVSSFSKSIQIDSADRIALRDMIAVPQDRLMTFVGRRDLFEIWRKDDYTDYMESNSYRLKK